MLLSTPGFWARLGWLVSVLALPLAVGAADAPSAPIPIWPKGSPQAAGAADADQTAIFSFLPSEGANTGAGVLIVPSASFTGNLSDREIVPVARWLNGHGITAFVLRYHSGPASAESSPIADLNRALQYLHAHAADFHLSDHRIGALGMDTGGILATQAAYAATPETDGNAGDPVATASNHPDFLALIYGASGPQTGGPKLPPTLLVGSTNAAANISGMIDLWNSLRAGPGKTPVEAHFFARAGTAPGLDAVWPDLFFNWVRAYGFLTDGPRVAIHGSVMLDGKPLPHGYVILTPLDVVGAGPIVARVFNSTNGVQIGDFTVPAAQGPVPGKYAVDVRQNMNRWLSNSFSNDLIRDPAFGHSRILSPSIDDQHSFTKAHPGDKEGLMLDIPPGGKMDIKIEVFSK